MAGQRIRTYGPGSNTSRPRPKQDATKKATARKSTRALNDIQPIGRKRTPPAKKATPRSGPTAGGSTRRTVPKKAAMKRAMPKGSSTRRSGPTGGSTRRR